MTDIEKILRRLDNLERAFLQSQKNGVKVTENSDLAPIVNNRVDEAEASIAENTESITDTQLGLADTFEAMEANQDAITVCEEAITELYEMIIPE